MSAVDRKAIGMALLLIIHLLLAALACLVEIARIGTRELDEVKDKYNEELYHQLRQWTGLAK